MTGEGTCHNYIFRTNLLLLKHILALNIFCEISYIFYIFSDNIFQESHSDEIVKHTGNTILEIGILFFIT